jgi:MFS family permease
MGVRLRSLTPFAGGRDRRLFEAGNFLYWLALYFYVPVLAVYAQTMGASLSVVGLMLSAYGVMQLLLRIPTGVASDALGRRKPFVLAGMALTAAGALGFLWAPAPWALVASRAVTGVAATAWVTITVMYAGYYPPAQTASAIGVLGFTNGLGQAVATWTGGVAAGAYGWRAPFVLSTAAGILGLVLMALCREPAPGAQAGRRGETRASAPGVAWRRVWRVGTAPALLLVSALSALNTYATFATIYGFIPVYAREIGSSAAELGALTAMSLVPFTLAQPLTAPLARRIGFPATVALSLGVSGATTLLVPWTHTFAALAATQAVVGVARGLLGASLMSLAIVAVPQHERATAMGVYQAVYSVGMFLGPLFSGVVGERAGLPAVFVSTGALSLVAGLVALFSLPAFVNMLHVSARSEADSQLTNQRFVPSCEPNSGAGRRQR